jgi:cytoskeleton protein RodZ
VSLGRRLAAARAERGLDLEDVSRATRIRVPILRALEADDLAAAGPPVYVRGHLRTLAGLLGLDPATLVAEYERQAPSSPEVPQAWQVRDPAAARADRRSPNWLGATVVTMGAVVALLVVGTVVEEPDDRVTVATPPPVASAPAVPAEGQPGDDAAGEEPAPDPDVQADAETDSETGAQPGTATDADERPDGDGSGADAVGGSGDGSAARGSSGGSSSAEPRRVDVRVSVAEGRSWLEVEDATGRSLHAAVLQAGESEEFTADRELRLTVGDASAVRLEVDGRRVEVRGGEGDIAKLRVRPGGRVTTG